MTLNLIYLTFNQLTKIPRSYQERGIIEEV
jgi:hypothetical protein